MLKQKILCPYQFYVTGGTVLGERFDRTLELGPSDKLHRQSNGWRMKLQLA
jgi:hypothetical protein